ncbi:hypothetical protein ABIF63_001629 [Bradyrhizobium japonicum]|uniref:Transposase n=1 Tax=Bradyrhizobium japonicum TaxID=375 RepID=A0ABV2RKQ4_BRAJP
MIPKSGHRFSNQTMRKTEGFMARKNVQRFSDKAMPSFKRG